MSGTVLALNRFKPRFTVPEGFTGRGGDLLATRERNGASDAAHSQVRGTKRCVAIDRHGAFANRFTSQQMAKCVEQ